MIYGIEELRKAYVAGKTFKFVFSGGIRRPKTEAWIRAASASGG